jgi:hypothetical protein
MQEALVAINQTRENILTKRRRKIIGPYAKEER